ncbi:MAG TPA: hypothetical protein VGG29_12230 [Caulobacteraceae bacterium]|jgi:hypothetical protein
MHAMATKPKPKPDDPKQSARFIEAAKVAGVDASGEAFGKAFKKVVPEKRKAAS